jgi:hypothetical protein
VDANGASPIPYPSRKATQATVTTFKYGEAFLLMTDRLMSGESRKYMLYSSLATKKMP